jgi:hypothetical protein
MLFLLSRLPPREDAQHAEVVPIPDEVAR